jgi:hypothetical protein
MFYHSTKKLILSDCDRLVGQIGDGYFGPEKWRKHILPRVHGVTTQKATIVILATIFPLT